MSISTLPQKDTSDGSHRMLAPVAYSETAIPALRLTRSSRLARRVGKILFLSLIAGTVLVAIAPWQQSVKGTGDVIAYAPHERQQTIEAPIKGRIVRLGEGIFENAHVTRGQLIAEIADVDAFYLERLEDQLKALAVQVEAAQAVLEANNRSLTAAETIVESFEAQVRAYEEVKQQVVDAANAEVESAKNKVSAEQQQLLEQEAALAQIHADFKRQTTLYEEDIVSELKFQEADRKFKEAKAKVEKSKAYVDAAGNDLAAKQSARNAKEQKAQVDIEYAKAALRKAHADVAKAQSEVAKAQTMQGKARKEQLDAETKVARQKNQTLVAPFDGFLTRITPNQSSKILKQGDPICEIVPDTADRAVQIWLKGNDAPLVESGRHVRLQFEGWPAIQFAGWPSVAVGTFGGQVISVDATDDGKGKFRVLVLPDESEIPWPNERFLRQGVRANGWVILDRVPLWYEIWRNMNGFPPVVSTEEPMNKGKVPKLPKT